MLKVTKSIQLASNNNILHLRLLKKDTNQFVNLMLIDISGEEYDNIIGDTKEAEENLSLIKFAKSIVVLIDGENRPTAFKKPFAK